MNKMTLPIMTINDSMFHMVFCIGKTVNNVVTHKIQVFSCCLNSIFLKRRNINISKRAIPINIVNWNCVRPTKAIIIDNSIRIMYVSNNIFSSFINFG